MNTITVDGVVTNKTWRYDGDSLFRLRHDNGDAHFTIRVKNLPIDIRPGMRIAVTGTLTSRDQRISLSDFVGRAHSGDDEDTVRELVDQLAGHLGPVTRSYTEVVAREIRPLQ